MSIIGPSSPAGGGAGLITGRKPYTMLDEISVAHGATRLRALILLPLFFFVAGALVMGYEFCWSCHGVPGGSCQSMQVQSGTRNPAEGSKRFVATLIVSQRGTHRNHVRQTIIAGHPSVAAFL